MVSLRPVMHKKYFLFFFIYWESFFYLIWPKRNHWLWPIITEVQELIVLRSSSKWNLKQNTIKDLLINGLFFFSSFLFFYCLTTALFLSCCMLLFLDTTSTILLGCTAVVAVNPLPFILHKCQKIFNSVIFNIKLET